MFIYGTLGYQGGIIKPGVPCFVAPQAKGGLGVLQGKPPLLTPPSISRSLPTRPQASSISRLCPPLPAVLPTRSYMEVESVARSDLQICPFFRLCEGGARSAVPCGAT